MYLLQNAEKHFKRSKFQESFGLARKKAKGRNRISSRHGDLLFSDQDDVDNFVDNYPHCGNKSPDQVYLRPLSLE